MVREVRGAGTLVPEEIRWIPATTSGRVESIVLRPGASVKPGTVILELSNPDLQQQANNAELDWKSGVAAARQRQVASLRRHAAAQESRGRGRRVAAQGRRGRPRGEQAAASSRAWSPTCTVKQKQAAVDRAKNALDAGGEAARRSRSRTKSRSSRPRRRRSTSEGATSTRCQRQLDDLQVKSHDDRRAAGRAASKRGQQVGPGANLARVSDPTHAQGDSPDLGNADEGPRDRSAGRHRHAQRPRQGPRLAHRPGVDGRHGRRRRHARRARCRRARGRT